MADEKEYAEIVRDEAEKLKEALTKKKRREEDAFNEVIGGIATVLLGGPILVVLIMAIGLVLCEAGAYVYNPSHF